MPSNTFFRGNRGIHNFFPIRIVESAWHFFSRSTGGMKIILVWVLSIILWLFFPWFQIADKNHGAFSLICGWIGWWISLLLVILCVQIFSYDLSQRIQKNWNFSIDKKNFFIRIWGVILLLSIVICTSLTGAARSIGKVDVLGDYSGMVFMMIGGFLVYLWGIIIKKSEEKTTYKNVFIQWVETENYENYKKILGESAEENMSLPI